MSYGVLDGESPGVRRGFLSLFAFVLEHGLVGLRQVYFWGCARSLAALRTAPRATARATATQIPFGDDNQRGNDNSKGNDKDNGKGKGTGKGRSNADPLRG
jgi:hypothetical protein